MMTVYVVFRVRPGAEPRLQVISKTLQAAERHLRSLDAKKVGENLWVLPDRDVKFYIEAWGVTP